MGLLETGASRLLLQLVLAAVLLGAAGPSLVAASSTQVRSGAGVLLWAAVPWVAWVGLTIVWALIAYLTFAGKRRLRATLLGSCALACVLALWPPYPWGRPAGGVRLTLQVDTDDGLRESGSDAETTARARPQVFQETIAVLAQRLEALGTVASVSPGRGDQVDIELFAVRDVESAKRILGTPARLSLQLVEGSAGSRELLLQQTAGRVPESLEVLGGPSDTPGQPTYYLLRKEAMISGRDFERVRVGRDEHNRPQINFSLNSTAASKFARETERSIGRQLAIVLDERVYSAPVIQSKLRADNRITGRFTLEEAHELTKILDAGPLPAGVRFISERPIPPASMLEPVMRASLVSILCLVVALLLVQFSARLKGAAFAAALVIGVGVVLAAMLLGQRAVSPPGVAFMVLALGLALERALPPR